MGFTSCLIDWSDLLEGNKLPNLTTYPSMWSRGQTTEPKTLVTPKHIQLWSLSKVVMDTELYIVGKDVAELKIPKKFRFEKISSDFKMSILLYGMKQNILNDSVFGKVLQKLSTSGLKSFPEKKTLKNV